MARLETLSNTFDSSAFLLRSCIDETIVFSSMTRSTIL